MNMWSSSRTFPSGKRRPLDRTNSARKSLCTVIVVSSSGFRRRLPPDMGFWKISRGAMRRIPAIRPMTMSAESSRALATSRSRASVPR